MGCPLYLRITGVRNEKKLEYVEPSAGKKKVCPTKLNHFLGRFLIELSPDTFYLTNALTLGDLYTLGKKLVLRSGPNSELCIFFRPGRG